MRLMPQLPNLVALLVLGGLIGKETKEYFAKQKAPKV